MTYDFTPLFRSSIGFDRLARLVDNATQAASGNTYPPYNIEKSGESSYVLTMAVAGFGPDDIEVTVQENNLLVVGRVKAEPSGEVLHRGIAGRAFERRFALADRIVVEGANLVHGLLQVKLARVVPEAMKPRRISIATSATDVPTGHDLPADPQVEGGKQAA